jgi:hypothetical protein
MLWKSQHRETVGPSRLPIFNTDWAVMRHRNGPLAIERASYLCYCASQGATRDSLRLKARSILWVAERMSQDSQSD